MFKNRFLTCVVIIILSISFLGCAGLQRKFSRRKKKDEDKIMPIVTTLDYSKELRADELYKKHFLFWKAWQTELIDRIEDGTYKKRRSCYDYTISSLLEMKKYLTGTKARELGVFISRLKTIDKEVGKKRLMKSKKHRMKQLLENTKRQIDKQFSYSNVKDFVALNK